MNIYEDDWEDRIELLAEFAREQNNLILQYISKVNKEIECAVYGQYPICTDISIEQYYSQKNQEQEQIVTTQRINIYEQPLNHYIIDQPFIDKKLEEYLKLQTNTEKKKKYL